MKTIITHGGQFHADEVLAIATLKFFLNEEFNIVRKFQVSQEELENKDIYVLDVGGVFDNNNNFDHHQYAPLAATNRLVLSHLEVEYRIKDLMVDNLYQIVSDIDKGLEKATPGSFSSIIASFNSLENGFDLALDVAYKVVGACYATAEKAVKAQDIWNKLVILGNGNNGWGHYKVYHDSKPIIGWKELAEKANVNFLVTPNTRGGYQIISRDSELFNIPENPKQTFRHNSGFMAVYESYEDAIEHVEVLI